MRNEEKLERAAEAAAWLKTIRGRTVPTFLPLLFDRHRHLIIKGGGGSGKSVFAAQKVIERCVSEPGHRFLVLRKVEKSIRQSCFKLLCDLAREYYPGEIEFIPKGESGDMYIRFKNSSVILFSGLDDVEKLKSIVDISSIWLEEATEAFEDDFDQLDIRLRGPRKYYKQIMLTFNPISINHWIKKRFWGRSDTRVRIHESTYKDNPFLPEEDRLTLEAFKETNPYYYTVYCLGQWGVLGKTYFSAASLQKQVAKQIKPESICRCACDYDGLTVSNIRLEPDEEHGTVKIYQLPEPGRPYVIGGDTAGEGSDYFIGQVLDNVTGQQVAVLRGSYETGMDEGDYARQMYCLGTLYNNALLAIETNFSTHPQKELERLGYSSFLVRERVDTYTGAHSKAYGFRTDSVTRPLILGDLQQIVREHGELIVDETTLDEMMTFTLNEKMRPEAEIGAHDDCVMALAIAFFARRQQRSTVDEKHRKNKWTKAMWDDYKNAGTRERQQLLEEWGRPVN